MINKLADLAQKAEPAFWLPGHPTDTLRSTIGGGALNCRVRHGTGWTHSLVTHRINNTKTTPRISSGPFFKLILAATYSPTDTLRSTIGDGVLNCRVRHGTGWIHSSITTRNFMNKRFHVYLLCHFARG